MSKQSDTIRAFLAIPVSRDLTQRLYNGVTLLRNTYFPDIRPVRIANMHITLKFFAELPAEHTQKIKMVMDQSVQNINPFTLYPNELGAFPGPAKPRVLWCGVKTLTNDYSRLVQSLNNECDNIGIETDRKKNIPHITLGRIRNPKRYSWPPREFIVKLFDNLPSFDVNSLELIQSTLLSSGVRYDRLHATVFSEDL